MTIDKYRKKPVEIQAVKWTGDNLLEITKFIAGAEADCVKETDCAEWRDYCERVRDRGLCIDTLEGTMHASVGDYIIKGIDGEFYPCKPDIFHRSYDKVEHETAADPLPETPCPDTGMKSMCSDIMRMVESFKKGKPQQDAVAYAIQDNQILYIVAVTSKADYVVESLQKALLARRTEPLTPSPYTAEDSLKGGVDPADLMSSSTSARYGILSWHPGNGGAHERG